MKTELGVAATLLVLASSLQAQSWPQGAGPSGGYVVAGAEAPTSWSVVHGRNIVWSKPLPETGQSTVTLHQGQLYYTCYVPVKEDRETAGNIVVYCADAATGKEIWHRTVNGKYPLRMSGCFNDSTSPPVVVTDKQVCVFNASGTIACFDREGEPLWKI